MREMRTTGLRAMAEAAARLKALYESLSPAQRSLFDRRVLLSQSEPLGPR